MDLKPLLDTLLYTAGVVVLALAVIGFGLLLLGKLLESRGF